MRSKLSIKMALLLLGVLPLFSDPAAADTIYLCRSYGGSEFWSNRHCREHSSFILRIVSVPTGMSFTQQVELAQQPSGQSKRAAQAASITQNAPARTGNLNNAVNECAQLDERVKQLDANSRQALSGQMQDAIRAERTRLRDRQFTLRCN